MVLGASTAGDFRYGVVPVVAAVGREVECVVEGHCYFEGKVAGYVSSLEVEESFAEGGVYGTCRGDICSRWQVGCGIDMDLDATYWEGHEGKGFPE